MSGGPVAVKQRDTNLDAIRGVALLGLFFTGAVAFGQPHAAFFNLSVPSESSSLDWAAAFIGELFFDQKMIALLALVCGASLMRFCDRLAEHGMRARGPGLRRGLALFLIGVPVGMHGLIWEGLPLWLFGFFTPVLLFIRKRSVLIVAIIGIASVLLAALSAIEFQGSYDQLGTDLGQYWIAGAHGSGDEAGAFVFFSTFFLLVGTMTLGLLVERRGLMTSAPGRSAPMTTLGFAFGLPLALSSVAWRHLNNYGENVSMIGEFPNTLAAVPMAIGFIGLINSWGNSKSAQKLFTAVARVGQMALTVSIVQTAFGLFVLRGGLFARGNFSRAELACMVVGVWAVQLVVADRWLERYQSGPVEWFVRAITYRQRPPLRR